MIGLFVNRLRDSNGGVVITPRPAGGIPATSLGQGRQGWAVASDGSSYSEELGSTPVPSTAIRSQGLAFTPDGALYTTVSAPTSTSAKIGGFAVRADGALHLADSSTVGVKIQGIALTADGRLITGGTSFDLPLVNMTSGVFTLTPRSSSGSSTPTYTRATAATTIDFEGLLKTCLSGEVRCLGGRRVYNQIAGSSVNLTNGSYALHAAGTGSNPVATANFAEAPDGSMTASRLVLDRGAGTTSGDVSYIDNGPGNGNANYKTSWWIKSNSGLSITLSYNGGVGDVTFTVTTAWRRITGAGQWQILNRGIHGTQIADVLVWGTQVENTTGQSNQNPSEYVSVGVLSAPTYHGVGVDGVKVFTTLNGNTVASNVVTEATGLSITSARAECAGGVTAGVVDAVGPVGYLAEGARANIALHSQDLSHAYWTALASGVTVTDNFAVAPDGTTTAAKFLNSNANAPHYTYNSGSPATRTASSKQATTIYAKFVDFQYITLQVDSGSGSYIQQGFDVQNGLVGTKTEVGGWTVSGTPTITAVGGGWYRCEVITQTGAGTNIVWALSVGGNGTLISVGDGVKYNLLWGFDNENNVAFASTYIPTTTAAVARNADVLTYPFAGNSVEASGAFYAEVSTQWAAGADGFSSMVVGFGGGAQISPMENTFTIPATQFQCSDGTTNGGKSGLSSTATGVRKRASSWSSAGMISTGDGLAPGAAAAYDGSFGSTGIGVGCNPNGSLQQWYGTIRNFRIYPRGLSAAQLQAMTA